MRIAFHDNCLCLRGTTVAIYDWAYWTRHYLDIDPIIMFNLKNNLVNSSNDILSGKNLKTNFLFLDMKINLK